MEGINGMIATASEVAAYYAVLARVTLGSGTMEYNWIYILIGIGIIIGAVRNMLTTPVPEGAIEKALERASKLPSGWCGLCGD